MMNNYPDINDRIWCKAKPGIFFLTLITSKRSCLFGSIQNDSLKLSYIGEIVREEWLKSFYIRDEMFCDAWVMMPNHIHGIIRIEKSKTYFENKPLQNPGKAYRPPRSIPSFVGCFKSAAIKHIWSQMNSLTYPIWEKGYISHPVSGSESLETFSQYINTNPATWKHDCYYMQ